MIKMRPKFEFVNGIRNIFKYYSFVSSSSDNVQLIIDKYYTIALWHKYGYSDWHAMYPFIMNSAQKKMEYYIDERDSVLHSFGCDHSLIFVSNLHKTYSYAYSHINIKI